MNKKTKIIRYSSFAVGMIALCCGVVFLFFSIIIPAIVCLTIAVATLIFAFLPYPFLKEQNSDENIG